MKNCYPVLWMVLLSLAVGTGCTKRPEGLPKLYPTQITLKTTEGMPIINAFVQVAAPENPINYSIGGITDAGGTALMMAQVPNGVFRGAPAGSLKVTVSKSLKIVTGDGPDEYTTAQLFPTDYQNFAQTPFEVTVKETGTNTAELECEINEDYVDYILK